jgi:hypothetical protein
MKVARQFIAWNVCKSHEVAKQNSPGLSPWVGVTQKIALKGRPKGYRDSTRLRANLVRWTTVGALRILFGRPREAVLGLPSPNCTPPRGVGTAFRAHLN